MPGHPVGSIMTLLKAPNSPSLHKHVLPHLIFEKTRWGGLSVSFGRGMTGCPAFSFRKQEGKPLLAGRRKHVRDKREPLTGGLSSLLTGLWARVPASTKPPTARGHGCSPSSPHLLAATARSRAVGWLKHSGPNPQGCTRPANLQDED